MKLYIEKDIQGFPKGHFNKKLLTVLGLEIEKDNIIYYVYDETFSLYPIELNSSQVTIVNRSLSRHWSVNVKSQGTVQIMFEDWINEPNFMLYFVDGAIGKDDIVAHMQTLSYYVELINGENID